jgi:hypothetical protein
MQNVDNLVRKTQLRGILDLYQRARKLIEVVNNPVARRGSASIRL